MRAIRHLCLFLLLCSCAFAQVKPEKQKQYDEELARGNELLKKHVYEDALEHFKKANKLAGQQSFPALIGLARVHRATYEYKDSIEDATKALALAQTDDDRVLAHLEMAATHSVDGFNNPKRRAERYPLAEQEARKALELSPSEPALQYHLGFVLLRAGKDDEGIALLKKFLEKNPNYPTADSARKLIVNPRRARERYLPDFTATTIDGKPITTVDLVGKIALLDFWATWCPACTSSVGELKRLAKKFSSDPVVIVGISADKDDDAWRRFVTKNEMSWPQVRDSGGNICKAFGVNVFPTYLLVDAEGIVQDVIIGSRSDIEGQIKKALKTLAKAEATEPKSD